MSVLLFNHISAYSGIWRCFHEMIKLKERRQKLKRKRKLQDGVGDGNGDGYDQGRSQGVTPHFIALLRGPQDPLDGPIADRIL